MAIVFWIVARNDAELEARRRDGARGRSLQAMLEPLTNIQVWRFSLYYFFVFGAFIALALWLPRYLMEVFNLDITSAGIIAAVYALPASLLCVYGGHLAETYGARRVMYWTFGVSAAACFILSYPPTEYIVHGIRGPMRFRLEMGPFAFAVIVFVLGSFMSFGKAAVYRPLYLFEHIHGESRERGQSMIKLLLRYRAHGLDPSTRELPDYLPLFLEFLSTRPAAEAAKHLAEVADIVGLLAARLRRRDAPQAPLLEAVAYLAADGAPAASNPEADGEGRDDTPAALDAAWEEAPVVFNDAHGLPGATTR